MPKKSTIVRVVRRLAPLLTAVSPRLAGIWLARLFTTPPGRRDFRAGELPWLREAQRSWVVDPDGHRLPVYAWGEGPTVLVAHGWASGTGQLTPLIGVLREAGLRVVAFDQPAHGRAEGGRAAIPSFARAIETVGAQVGPLEAIVAHSAGAAATTIALSRGLDVRRLVYFAPPENLPGYLGYVASMLGFGPAALAPARRALEARFRFKVEDARGSTLAPKMERPLLLIHDRDDREVPYGDGEGLVRDWGGPAELLTTHGLGHNRILRDPDLLREVVRFLSEPIPARGVSPGATTPGLPAGPQALGEPAVGDAGTRSPVGLAP